MQSENKLSAVSKAAAAALRSTVSGLRMASTGGTRSIGKRVTALFEALFVFREFIDAEARATCAAFGTQMEAATVLRSTGPLGHSVSTDEVLRQLHLKSTTDKVKRAFGTKVKQEGKVVAAAPSSSSEAASKPESGAEPPSSAPADASAAQAAAPQPEHQQQQQQQQEEQGLVPVLDFAAFVRSVDTALCAVRGGLADATAAVRDAKLEEMGAKHEKTREQLREAQRAERERLDGALREACDGIEREAEKKAAELRDRHEQRLRRAADTVALAESAIRADASANPLAQQDSCSSSSSQ